MDEVGGASAIGLQGDMSATISSTGVEYHKVSHTPITEKLRVWFINSYHWRTKWAVRHLSKQLRRDPEFRESWKANIAMPIYDATRPVCNCGQSRFEPCLPQCARRQHAANAYLFEMPPKQCNAIADRLMKHLFGA